MSRYIDADALIKRFGELTVMLWLDSVEEAEIVSLIGNSPSIDIVFCKDCKFWKKVSSCMSKRPNGYCDEGKKNQ